MIAERHYDDETLIGLLGSRSLDAVRDPHLAICSSCSDTLASYRAVAEVLGEEAAWDLRDLRNEPVPETIAALRAFLTAADADDDAAAAAAGALLSRPRSEWFAAAESDLQLQTPAVVKALVHASETAMDTDPAQSLDVARLAAHVALMLIPQTHPHDVVYRSRGAAWRQFAYAAFYVGDYRVALDATARAAGAFEECRVADYDIARVQVVRGSICSALEQHDEALTAARGAARVFSGFGDRQRFAAARTGEAVALMCQLRYREALPVLEDIETAYSADIDNDARARVLINLGLCRWQLGDIPRALSSYAVAAAICDEIGNAPEAARIRYNIAALLAAEGRHSDATIRFRAVRDEFQRLGMAHMAVAAGLELAELLLVDEAFFEAEQLCEAAIEQFERTGLSATTEAMTALSYLREAAAQRRVTPQTVRHVREFMERLPREPELLFAPPAPPLS